MKKILGIVFLGLLASTSAHSDNIKDFKIENISIGESALDYFTETEIENGELDWFNYSYKEYSTSLVSGKGIYDWFKISYKSNDANFKIEGLVGIVVKKNYNKDKCNQELDTAALNVSVLFKNTKQRKKKIDKVVYNPRKVFQESSQTGKSTVTSISFDFKDKGKIILSCYDMDRATNQIDSPLQDINQFDTFRIDIRSKVFKNYLEKV
ncbi:hypothetical protein OAJ40_00390 [Candidatus Pelagibacter sp.]|nr:hypothetical protein [Candidatus Pelagibacter sp.]